MKIRLRETTIRVNLHVEGEGVAKGPCPRPYKRAFMTTAILCVAPAVIESDERDPIHSVSPWSGIHRVTEI
jgi:hypothetical protein